MPKPVVAAVQGAAAGFGLSLVLAADLALAAEDAVFTSGYIHLGTSPDGGMTATLSRVVGLKRAAELLAHVFAHLHGMRILCLRLFTVYGPRQRPDLAIHRFIDAIARDRPVPMHGDGSSEREYTYISDAVDGVLAGLDWTGRRGPGCVAINLGGGERVRLDRLIDLVARASHRDARIERCPEQPGDVRLTAADLGRAERELGYRPRVGIEEGIGHFVRWYEATHGRQS